MKIEIITTPNEELKETGFGTLKACHSVFDSIERMGHMVKLSVCKTRGDLNDIVERKPDLVILAVKYISFDNQDNIWLSEYFAGHGVNFTGSSREVLDFDSNKVLAKSHLRKNGITTANYFTATPGQYKHASELPFTFPLFLKPSDAANGNGVDDSSFVTNFADFESKVLSLYLLFNLPVLVEEYLDGREFTVAVIKAQNGELIVSPIEIVPLPSTNGLRILGEKAKKDDSEELKKTEDSEIINRVKKLAVDAFVNLRIRDFGRIDIKTNKSGACFFMEVNLVPGMKSGSSYFPKACEIEHGLTYDKVVKLMIGEGIRRISSSVSSIKHVNSNYVATPLELVTI